MRIQQWLKEAEEQLTAQGVKSARLDALILLEDSTHKNRSWLLAHQQDNLEKVIDARGPSSSKGLNELNQALQRRANHEPLSYIRGKSAFYGREFIVTKDTLQPRPETETMVELALQEVTDQDHLVDVGTGSGAIAITMKLERPNLAVTATDISKNCVITANKNAKHLHTNITVKLGNLLTPLTNNETPTVIMANLPYVPDDFTINQAAMFEPKIAIFGGKDGLDYYRQLFEQINTLSSKPQLVFIESLPPQHDDLSKIALSHGYTLSNTVDFIQQFEPKKVNPY